LKVEPGQRVPLRPFEGPGGHLTPIDEMRGRIEGSAFSDVARFRLFEKALQVSENQVKLL